MGWQAVPAIDGKICSTWNDTTAELFENGLQAHMRDDWSDIPLVIKNQRVFSNECGVLPRSIAANYQVEVVSKREEGAHD